MLGVQTKGDQCPELHWPQSMLGVQLREIGRWVLAQAGRMKQAFFLLLLSARAYYWLSVQGHSWQYSRGPIKCWGLNCGQQSARQGPYPLGYLCSPWPSILEPFF